jgi:hypothetical protein
LNQAAVIKATSAGFSLSVVAIAAWGNIRPPLMGMPNLLLPILFGICLAAFIGADYCWLRASTGETPNQASAIRRSSRLVYIWLYLLFGANSLAAGLSNQSFESAAERLGSFLVAGIVLLVLIRLLAIAGVSGSARATLDKDGQLHTSGQGTTEVGTSTAAPAGLKP